MRNKSKFIGFGMAVVILTLTALPVMAEDSNNTANTTAPVPTSINHDLQAKFRCSTSVSGQQTCLENSDDSNTGGGQANLIIKKLDDLHVKQRELRITAIGVVYQNEINRAQKAIDNLQNIIDRIKAQRTKIATTANATDLAKLDALIAQADTQKQDAVNALADVKTKAAAIKTTLATAKANADASMDVSTNDLTNLKQEIKDFQTSVVAFKTKLNTLYKTLQQTVVLLKSMTKTIPPPATTQDSNNTNSTSTNNAGSEEQH